MIDRATPNLPSRDFAATSRFYAALGFAEQYRDAWWMIMTRGTIALEFFPYPDLDPATSSFGSCVRVNDLDALYADCKRAGIPEKSSGFPRLHPPKQESWGGTVAALLDPDGSLLRLIRNPTD
jgi:catechol 2,3-dioxygenase-like lactoylglutathione lyase family enzyme